MLKFSDMAAVGRKVRQDDWDDLGVATPKLIEEAIEDGRYEKAKALGHYTVPESKGLHDLFCDWLWDLFTQIAERHGEEELHQMLRATQGGWMMRRTWKGFLNMSVEERVYLTAEIMRAHHCGPDQQGDVEITDEGDRYALKMDPCGSGGRMRRGDPVDGTPSRLGPPYNFGCTKQAHDWSWGKKDVPYYCVHCVMNEVLPMEWGGHPLWVTGFDHDAEKPCYWYFYKKAEDIPEEFYTRVGREKPKPGEGEY
jgi:hypothetical protein